MQPNTTLLDCILYLMQLYIYDPGNVSSSANQCILEKRVSKIQSIKEVTCHTHTLLSIYYQSCMHMRSAEKHSPFPASLNCIQRETFVT